MPKTIKVTAEDIIQEFLDDIKAAYGEGRSDKLDEDYLKWPDLAVTYKKARKYIKERSK